MTTSDPMDVDHRPPENGEGGPTSDRSPLSKDTPLPGTDEPHKPDTSVKSKSPPPPKEPVAHDKGIERSDPKKDTSESSISYNPGSVQDEIVVGQHHKPNPQSKRKPNYERPDEQVELVIPSKPLSSEGEATTKMAATPAPTTQAKFEPKDEDAATPNARRNPKRAASAMAQIQPVKESSHGEILDATLKPVEAKELEDWLGWVELESEPVRPLRSHGLGVSIL